MHVENLINKIINVTSNETDVAKIRLNEESPTILGQLICGFGFVIVHSLVIIHAKLH